VDFVTIFTEGSMKDKTIARLQSAAVSNVVQDYRVQEYRLPSPPLLDVMYYVRVSEDSQIFLALPTLKRKKSWVIFIYLWGK